MSLVITSFVILSETIRKLLFIIRAFLKSKSFVIIHPSSLTSSQLAVLLRGRFNTPGEKAGTPSLEITMFGRPD